MRAAAALGGMGSGSGRFDHRPWGRRTSIQSPSVRQLCCRRARSRISRTSPPQSAWNAVLAGCNRAKTPFSRTLYRTMMVPTGVVAWRHHNNCFRLPLVLCFRHQWGVRQAGEKVGVDHLSKGGGGSKQQQDERCRERVDGERLLVEGRRVGSREDKQESKKSQEGRRGRRLALQV